MGNKLVKYEALIPVALKAIQEQTSLIQNQQQQIDLLKKQNLEILQLLKNK